MATEQNFTCIAAIKPKVAFILDIRRQNLIELLMYKALFEMSADRVEFVSTLFSRPKPTGLSKASSAEQVFKAFEPVAGNADLYKQTLQAIRDRLVKQHPAGQDAGLLPAGRGGDGGRASPVRRAPSHGAKEAGHLTRWIRQWGERRARRHLNEPDRDPDSNLRRGPSWGQDLRRGAAAP